MNGSFVPFENPLFYLDILNKMFGFEILTFGQALHIITLSYDIYETRVCESPLFSMISPVFARRRNVPGARRNGP